MKRSVSLLVTLAFVMMLFGCNEITFDGAPELVGDITPAGFAIGAVLTKAGAIKAVVYQQGYSPTNPGPGIVAQASLANVAASTQGIVRITGTFTRGVQYDCYVYAIDSSNTTMYASALAAVVPTDPYAPSDTSRQGNYTWKTYTSGLSSSAYDDAIVYYPADAGDGPFPVAIFSHGYMANKDEYYWLAERLASHGYIVLFFNVINHLVTCTPEDWVGSFKGAIATIKAEDQRAASPVYQKVDETRIALMGHSMGGGGALWTANELGTGIQAVIGCNPYDYDSKPGKIAAPALLIAGSDDITATPSMVKAFYTAMPSDTDRVFMEIDGVEHNDVKTDGSSHVVFSKYIVAWLNIFLKGDTRYYTFVNGDAHAADVAAGWFTAYLSSL